MKLHKEVTPVIDSNGETVSYYWYIVTYGDLMSGHAGKGATPEIAKKSAIKKTNELSKETVE